MNTLKTLILGFIFSMSSSLASAQGADTVEFFNGTLAEAFVKAEESGKRVFVDFYTEWCGPCKALDQHVFPTPEAAAYFNKHFINVKIDAEKGDGPELRKTYEITAYPTFIIFDGAQRVYARWMGGSMRPTPEQFIARVEQEVKKGVSE